MIARLQIEDRFALALWALVAIRLRRAEREARRLDRWVGAHDLRLKHLEQERNRNR